MRQILLVSIVISMTTMLLYAQEQYTYKDGNQLLRQCDTGTSEDKSRMSSDQSSDYAFCAGYVAGAMDANNTFLNSMQAAKKEVHLQPMYCLPQNGIEIGQAVRITVKWLRDHPEKLHQDGVNLVWRALSDAFPCK